MTMRGEKGLRGARGERRKKNMRVWEKTSRRTRDCRLRKLS